MLLLFLLGLPFVVASLNDDKYQFKLNLIKYDSMGRDSNGNKCDWIGECDIGFRICLHPLVKNINDDDSNVNYCPNTKDTGRIAKDKDVIYFDAPYSYGGVQNPVFVTSKNPWGGMVLKMKIYDYDRIFGDRDDVDEIVRKFDGELPLKNTKWSIEGKRSNSPSLLLVTVDAKCINGYMGPRCDCHSQHGELGHYTCNSDGSKKCKKDYYNLDNFCRSYCPRDTNKPPRYTCHPVSGTKDCMSGFGPPNNCSVCDDDACLGQLITTVSSFSPETVAIQNILNQDRLLNESESDGIPVPIFNRTIVVSNSSVNLNNTDVTNIYHWNYLNWARLSERSPNETAVVDVDLDESDTISGFQNISVLLDHATNITSTVVVTQLNDETVTEPVSTTTSTSMFEPVTLTTTTVPTSSHAANEPVTLTTTTVPTSSHTANEPVTLTTTTVPTSSHTANESVTLTTTTVPTSSHTANESVTLTTTTIPTASHTANESVTLTTTTVPTSSHTANESVTLTTTTIRTASHTANESVTLTTTTVPTSSHTANESVTMTTTTVPTSSHTANESVTMTTTTVPTSSHTANESVTMTTTTVPTSSHTANESVTLTTTTVPTSSHTANESVTLTTTTIPTASHTANESVTLTTTTVPTSSHTANESVTLTTTTVPTSSHTANEPPTVLPVFPGEVDCTGIGFGKFSNCKCCEDYVICLQSQSFYMKCPDGPNEKLIFDNVTKSCLYASYVQSCRDTPVEYKHAIIEQLLETTTSKALKSASTSTSLPLSSPSSLVDNLTMSSTKRTLRNVYYDCPSNNQLSCGRRYGRYSECECSPDYVLCHRGVKYYRSCDSQTEREYSYGYEYGTQVVEVFDPTLGYCAESIFVKSCWTDPNYDERERYED